MFVHLREVRLGNIVPCFVHLRKIWRRNQCFLVCYTKMFSRYLLRTINRQEPGRQFLQFHIFSQIDWLHGTPAIKQKYIAVLGKGDLSEIQSSL
jgi:hypothetical protein